MILSFSFNRELITYVGDLWTLGIYFKNGSICLFHRISIYRIIYVVLGFSLKLVPFEIEREKNPHHLPPLNESPVVALSSTGVIQYTVVFNGSHPEHCFNL